MHSVLVLVVFAIFRFSAGHKHHESRQEFTTDDQIVEVITKTDEWEFEAAPRGRRPDIVIMTSDDNRDEEAVAALPSAIKAGQPLNDGQCLKSPNHAFTACMQADGNFVVAEHGGKGLWHTNTAAKGTGPFRFVLQQDSDLILVDSEDTTLWSSRTNGKGTKPRLVLQDDSSLCIIDSNDKKIWCSNADQPDTDTDTEINFPPGSTLASGQTLQEGQCLKSPNQVYKACLQTDGNFCVHQNAGGIWCSYSHGKGPTPRRLTLHTNNDLVEYCAQNSALWSSKTKDKGGAPGVLTMQDDGNLVIYAKGKALWSTKPYPSTTSNTFGPDQVMLENDCITSPNQVYKFCVQTDGNLCTYKNGAGDWCTYSHGKGTAPRRLVIGTDNNMIEYDTTNTNIWMTKTNGQGTPGTGILTMRDNGNLDLTSQGKVLWSNRRDGVLGNGETMTEGDCLKSPNQVYKACLQADGNFCVYQNTGGVWCSYSHGKGSQPRRITMQTDNNLVEFDAANTALWLTKTNGKSTAPASLVMQDDGNLVIFADGKALWSTKPYPTNTHTFGPDQVMFEGECIVAPNKVYKFCIQGDGNLCTYKNGAGLWCSYSHGKGTVPRRLIMNADNNVIEYDAANTALWTTVTGGGGTHGTGALTIQNDGNLVLRSGGKVLWTSMQGKQ